MFSGSWICMDLKDPQWNSQGIVYSPSFQARRVEDGEETDARHRTKNSCRWQR
jgi:hypothetical protein